MKGLISFSLYGNAPKYVLGLYENLDLAPEIYPGWDVRVYIERHHYATAKIRRRWPQVQVVEKPPTPGSSGMFWRLESVLDQAYSHVIVRDVDSRLSHRERSIVSDWIASERALHVIRDHPAHNLIPVLGGAHGYMPAKFPDMAQWLRSWQHSNRYGDDEKFLHVVVWDSTPSGERLVHTSQGKRYGGQVLELEVPTNTEGAFICQPMVPDWRKHLSKLYVVNAPHYKRRFERFKRALEKSSILSSLEVVRFEGCKREEQLIPYWWRGDREHWWLASQDHKRLMHSALVSGEDMVLIFEDDGHPNEHFDEYFERAWQTSPANWWALMLGGQSDHQREYVSHELREHLALANGIRGQHAVLWNWEGMKYFWDHCMYWNWQTIDEAFEGYQKECRRVYSPARWIVDIVGVQFGQDN